MMCYRAAATFVFVYILSLACSAPSIAWAQAGTITKGMQDNCVNEGPWVQTPEAHRNTLACNKILLTISPRGDEASSTFSIVVSGMAITSPSILPLASQTRSPEYHS